jgi:hypothetical protein
MAKGSSGEAGRASSLSPTSEKVETGKPHVQRLSALVDTRVICGGDDLEQLRKLPVPQTAW